MSRSTASAWPDGIGPEHVRELTGWRHHASPLSLVVFGVVVALALSGILGHERDWEVTSGDATLRVHMPETIRNGEFLEIQLEVESATAIGELVIGVEASLWQDITVNTMVPAATEESSEDGELWFTFAALDPGTTFLWKVDAQVNPDSIGGTEGTITVYDGDEPLVSQPIRMTVLP